MLVNMIPCYTKLNVVNSQLQVKGGGKKADSNHSIHVFTRLILCGKVREVVRWITGQASGGVLDVNIVDASLQSYNVLRRNIQNLVK